MTACEIWGVGLGLTLGSVGFSLCPPHDALESGTDMPKRSIFISCGQFTDAEKQLGKDIAEMVRTHTGMEPFFAEDVHDLNGLDTNILNALHDCVAFIAVLHPRGEIARPDSPVLVRASVWIEQEIAIATYIQLVEKRELPIIAFKHKSVGREGLRELIHLNPIEFTDESEVLAALPEHITPWKSLKPSGIEIQIYSEDAGRQDDHVIRTLNLRVVNDTNSRIKEYFGRLYLPDAFMRHWNETFIDSSLGSGGIRSFNYDQTGRGPINPHDSKLIFTQRYCTRCALPAYEGIPGAVASAKISATIWIDNREYSAETTIQKLAEDL
jgi:hypothetical protein